MTIRTRGTIRWQLGEVEDGLGTCLDCCREPVELFVILGHLRPDDITIVWKERVEADGLALGGGGPDAAGPPPGVVGAGGLAAGFAAITSMARLTAPKAAAAAVGQVADHVAICMLDFASSTAGSRTSVSLSAPSSPTIKS